jgi:hypothetical protein
MKKLLVVVALLSACATPPPPPAPKPAPSPVSSSEAMEDDIARETRKTAAAELDCPAEQLIVTCTQRDSLGGCVAIQARGCDKTLEYSFGNE